MKKNTYNKIIAVLILCLAFVFSACNNDNSSSSDDEMFFYSNDKLEDRIKQSDDCTILKNINDYLIIHHNGEKIDYVEQFIYVGEDTASLKSFASTIYSIKEEQNKEKIEILNPYIILKQPAPDITASQMIENYENSSFVVCEGEIDLTITDEDFD